MLTRLKNSRIDTALDEFAALEVTPGALIVTIVLSTGLGLAALALSAGMVVTTIAEMSMAMVNSNSISGNGKCGIHVVDQSMAQLSNNQVRHTKPGPSGAADGIKAEYLAEIMLRSNTIDAPPGHGVMLQSEATVEPWQ